jgi:hypothetical protein
MAPETVRSIASVTDTRHQHPSLPFRHISDFKKRKQKRKESKKNDRFTRRRPHHSFPTLIFVASKNLETPEDLIGIDGFLAQSALTLIRSQTWG